MFSNHSKSCSFRPVAIYIKTVFFILVFFLTGDAVILGCDTWIAMQKATQSGKILFAKNSDRTVFDSQPLLLYPAKKWKVGAMINLGRVSIPQASETYAVIGSSPYWCWGFEEGMNEYGVFIGNEGVFTKSLEEEIEQSRKDGDPVYGPTGMDILRLALERSRTAIEAVGIIGEITVKYGQFGSGLPTLGFMGAYHNSYMVADPEESWILETARKHWVARKISENVASISNTLSIGATWDLSSVGVEANAKEKGWWKHAVEPLNFSEAYSSDQPRYKMAGQRVEVRANCSLGLLEEKAGEIDIKWMMRIARDRSTVPSLDLDVTASSCVAVLPQTHEELPIFWWAASVPGVSCYIPYFAHSDVLPDVVSSPGTAGRMIVPPSKVKADTYSEGSFWWRFRDLADMANLNWEERKIIIRSEFDKLEREFIDQVEPVSRRAADLIQKGNKEKAAKLLSAYTNSCVEKVMIKLEELRSGFRAEKPVIDKTQFKDCIGSYEIQPGVKFDISLNQQDLFCSINRSA